MSDDILAQILARLAMIEAGQTELRAALLALTARIETAAERIERVVRLYGRD